MAGAAGHQLRFPHFEAVSALVPQGYWLTAGPLHFENEVVVQVRETGAGIGLSPRIHFSQGVAS